MYSEKEIVASNKFPGKSVFFIGYGELKKLYPEQFLLKENIRINKE